MVRRARRDALARVTALFGQDSRARRQAPLALTIAGAKAGVTFERLDVAVPKLDAVHQLMQRHVFAAADELFHPSRSSVRVRRELAAQVGHWPARFTRFEDDA